MTRATRNQHRRCAELEIEVARLATAIEAIAPRVVELTIDMRELQSQRRRPAPPGLTRLKRAAASTAVSYATCRRLALAEGAAIGAVRVGGYWFCDEAKLIARVGTKAA